MTLNKLLERLNKLQQSHGEKEVSIMLELSPRDDGIITQCIQINDTLKDIAFPDYGVILIGTEWSP